MATMLGSIKFNDEVLVPGDIPELPNLFATGSVDLTENSDLKGSGYKALIDGMFVCNAYVMGAAAIIKVTVFKNDQMQDGESIDFQTSATTSTVQSKKPVSFGVIPIKSGNVIKVEALSGTLNIEMAKLIKRL